MTMTLQAPVVEPMWYLQSCQGLRIEMSETFPFAGQETESGMMDAGYKRS